MFKNIYNCRALAQRPRLTSQRWMSSRPTYNSWHPQPDADGWYDGRKHPRRLEDFDSGKTRPREDQRSRGARPPTPPLPRSVAPIRRTDDFNSRSSRVVPRDDRGRDERFSTSLPRRSPPRPRRLSRDVPQVPKRKGGGFVLMPKLSQEELDKISNPNDVWEARSLYFVPPKRSKEHQQPIQLPKPLKPEPRRRDRDAGIASADSIKAAIQAPAKTRAKQPRPPPPPEIELEGDGGTIVADPVNDLPHALAAKFFLSPPATFLYSAFRLKHHPINTTTPEICVVGASNCGKSSFINALTGAASLAKVSDRAGKTVSMNAYGVGPLTGLPFRKPVASTAASSGAGGGVVTKEEKPEHGIILVDTPGYGYASHEEWGHEIVEYINKRTMLRGIVLLLSSEKKVSEKDAQIVKLLADAGRPVMLVFTKMDKALSRKAREEGGIAQRLREAERCFARTGWSGWVRRVYITAAGMERDKSWKVDGTRSAAGMAGVRMGVLELAGVREFVAPERVKMLAAQQKSSQKSQKVQEGGGAGEDEKRLEPGKALESDPAAWSGDVVSFEELEKKFGDWTS
ncbi:ribosome biogenesis GTP-binding protein YsxC [Colletotrichum orchidophilum]|uniref:Ribosome biogenesis GTP-binding protein YsxC n=1 Tax=Colletotrichum orchidophilum TaxID=1209926 RepID=A0A1G4B9G5_9PEZI|nr:ribosome biogenesis GTP-binding protein YsxC [Colletotrichum orchidophilum]OHE98049.1 ribosome biogenesis GTP-binding protein YsxC [Colletotrichum orchidophilum]